MMQLPEMVRYHNDQLELSILVPQAWHGQLLEGAQFRILAPPEPDFGDYRSTMSFRRGRPEGHGDGWLEALFARAGEEMRENYADFEPLREARLPLSGGVPAYARYFRWTEPGTGQRFSQLQALILEDGIALYLVNAATLTALEARYMPLFELILRSIQISATLTPTATA